MLLQLQMKFAVTIAISVLGLGTAQSGGLLCWNRRVEKFCSVRAWDAPRPATRTGADSTVGERSDRGPTRDESSVSAVCVCWLTPTLIQVSRLRPGSDCAGRVETGSTSGCKGPLGSSVQGAAWFVSARGRLVRQSCHQARHKRAGETVPGRRSRSNAGDDGCTECGACSTGGHTDGENFGADRDHPVQCVKE